MAVIPTQAQVQGLAALAVHEPGRTFDQDVLEMTATARHARHGAVTIAARQAMTMAGPCEPGDVLGVVEGDFAVVGDDLYEVATDVLEPAARRRRRAGHARRRPRARPASWPGAARRWVEEHAPAVDVVVYDGGQERYPLLMSVRVSRERPRSRLDSPVASVSARPRSKRDARSSTGSASRPSATCSRHFPRRYVETGELTDVDELEPRARC